MTSEPLHQCDKQATLLLVDDAPANIQVLASILSKEGYRLSAATGGLQALTRMEQSLPCLVLLDVSMPEMDGYEVCRRMKANLRTAEVPVIFLTGKTSQEDIMAGFEAGAVDYVSKPFNAPELLARVRTHVALRRMIQLEREARTRLEDALVQVKTLSGLLPMCAQCKKIRDDKGYWNQLEGYLTEHANVMVSHGICPDCAHELYPEIFARRAALEPSECVGQKEAAIEGKTP